MSHRKQLTGGRVVRESAGRITPSIPEPVDLVGNAALLKSNTAAFLFVQNSLPSRLILTSWRILKRAVDDSRGFP
jgi:hypothetical protein